MPKIGASTNPTKTPLAAPDLSHAPLPTVTMEIERLKSGNYRVRRNAAEALGRIGDAAAVPALIDAMADEDAGVSSNAVFALQQIGTPEALAAIGATKVESNTEE